MRGAASQAIVLGPNAVELSLNRIVPLCDEQGKGGARLGSVRNSNELARSTAELARHCRPTLGKTRPWRHTSSANCCLAPDANGIHYDICIR